MTKNEKIQKMKQVMKQRRDEDLQALYRRAARSSVSPITIMRLWYGQVSLSEQPKELLDFLVRALDEEDGCPEPEHWSEANEAGATVAELNDPWALRELIEKNVGVDEEEIASVLAVLAWMGFEQEEALDIRLEDVDILRRTICTRKIPYELYPVVTKYFFDWACMFETSIGRRSGDLRTGGGHYLIKTEHKGRASETVLAATIEQYGLSYEEIRAAGEYGRLKRTEAERCSADIW